MRPKEWNRKNVPNTPGAYEQDTAKIGSANVGERSQMRNPQHSELLSTTQIPHTVQTKNDYIT
eukprot:3962072-Amphidinium_carterae.1